MNFSLEINSTVISTVVANDKAVSKLKGVNSKNTDAINKTKLQTIAHLSADLADETRFPRNKKGKTVFGKNVSSGIKLQLSDAGIKDATAKELSELSQFLIRHLSLMATTMPPMCWHGLLTKASHHRPSLKLYWLVVTPTRVILRSYWTRQSVDKTSRLVAGQMLQPCWKARQS